MNIRTLEIDFDKGILKCNGKSYTESPIIVTLPGPDDNFKYSKLFNERLATGNRKEVHAGSHKIKREVTLWEL